MLEEVQKEEKSGLLVNAPPTKTHQPESSNKKSKSGSDIDDNYMDDFEDDIQEDLPEVDDNQFGASVGRGGAGEISGSGQGVTVSQSLGVDPSVDSLALENYDHIEPVERI